MPHQSDDMVHTGQEKKPNREHNSIYTCIKTSPLPRSAVSTEVVGTTSVTCFRSSLLSAVNETNKL